MHRPPPAANPNRRDFDDVEPSHGPTSLDALGVAKAPAVPALSASSPYPQRADFTLKIGRQSCCILAIRHALSDALSDALPIVRQTVRIDEIDLMSTCVSNLRHPLIEGL